MTNDKLSCDSSTGDSQEKHMMAGELGSPAGFTEVMFRMHVLWHLMFQPRQISNNGMRSNDQWSHTVVTLLCLSFLPFSPSQLFFHLMNPMQHPHNAVLSGPEQAPLLVLIGIIVWNESEPPLCPSSYSFHGVTGWHRNSSEILQGAACWKCIPAQHRGFNPPTGLSSCWIRCVVFCQQLLL